jgi:hypothetical protein
VTVDAVARSSRRRPLGPERFGHDEGPLVRDREPVGGGPERIDGANVAERAVHVHCVARDLVGATLGHDERTAIGRESDLRAVGRRKRPCSALERHQVAVDEAEPSDHRVARGEHVHETLVLGDAARCGPDRYGLGQFEHRAVHGEDADVVAGDVGHEQVATVPRERDRALRR